jgi:uncharacterized protein (TIGR02996 family)
MTDAAAAEQMGLLADIIAHPGEDGPRLIYADWLEDSGGGVRAEFIRAGVAGRPTVYRLRGGTYMTFTHQWPWREHTVHCPDHVENCTVGGGFVEAVRLPLAAWLEHGPALVRAHPLTRVELSDREPALGDVGTKTGGMYGWFDDGRGPDREDLPFRLWGLLGGGAQFDLTYWKFYDTPAAAIDALSAACLAWARAVDPAGGAA